MTGKSKQISPVPIHLPFTHPMGQPDSIVEDIENMDRSYIEKEELRRFLVSKVKFLLISSMVCSREKEVRGFNPCSSATIRRFNLSSSCRDLCRQLYKCLRVKMWREGLTTPLASLSPATHGTANVWDTQKYISSFDARRLAKLPEHRSNSLHISSLLLSLFRLEWMCLPPVHYQSTKSEFRKQFALCLDSILQEWTFVHALRPFSQFALEGSIIRTATNEKRGYESEEEPVTIQNEKAVDPPLKLKIPLCLPPVEPTKEKRAKAMPGFRASEYRKMLCVDGTIAEKVMTLNSGQEWTGRLDSPIF
ncbi:hypothetical protein ACFE04_007789 [Oxalis oulophora]